MSDSETWQRRRSFMGLVPRELSVPNRCKAEELESDLDLE